MDEHTITLPWPPKELSSNARGHWSKRNRATKGYRGQSGWLTKKAKVPKIPGATLEFTFHPPDKRRRDCQNMPWAMKAAIDGIADGMGCDDHEFQCVFPKKFADVVAGGSVVVRIMRPISDGG